MVLWNKNNERLREAENRAASAADPAASALVGPQPPSSSMYDVLWHTGRYFVADPGNLARLRRCSRSLYNTLPEQLLYEAEMARSRAQLEP